ncbi:Retrovirus-related Pol polyprotein from type-1 retrotransposable element R2, partial [Toxocara canis]
KEICKKFYEQLFSSIVPVEAPDLSMPSFVPEVTRSEVEKAIRATNQNKAAAIDQIHAEEIRADGEILAKALSARFPWYLNLGKILAEWKRSRTVLIPKKGNHEDIRNYRPICLLSHVYKVFMRVIYNRIESILDEKTGRELAGFRKRFSTIDHILALTQLIERCRDYWVPVCLLFVDFKKTFDLLKHNAILQSLSDQGVDPVYIVNIKDPLSESNTEIILFERPISI